MASEQRERHATADRLIGQTYETIQRSVAAQRVLGAAFLDYFHKFACNYYVPDQKNGMYVPSRKAMGKDAHPVVVSGKYERPKLSMDFVDLCGEQYARAYALAPLFGIPERKIDRALSKSIRRERACYGRGGATYNSSEEDDYLAVVIRFTPGLYNTPNAHLNTRPIMAVPDRSDSLSPYIFVHELTHHMQFMHNPIVRVEPGNFGRERMYLRYEHEAYAVEGSLLGKLDVAPMADALDSLRRAKLAAFILQYPHLLEEWRDPVDEFNFNARNSHFGEEALVGGNWYQLP